MLILWWQSNVIIDQYGRARLTEYGLAPISAHPAFLGVESNKMAVGQLKWLAPEILRGGAEESKEADVFAFGMVAMEAFTEVQSEIPEFYIIIRGVRPTRPRGAQGVGLTDDMWELLETCWRRDPVERPTMQAVVTAWDRLVGDAKMLDGEPQPRLTTQALAQVLEPSSSHG